jgi:hypothetical protein
MAIKHRLSPWERDEFLPSVMKRTVFTTGQKLMIDRIVAERFDNVASPKQHRYPDVALSHCKATRLEEGGFVVEIQGVKVGGKVTKIESEVLCHWLNEQLKSGKLSVNGTRARNLPGKENGNGHEADVSSPPVARDDGGAAGGSRNPAAGQSAVDKAAEVPAPRPDDEW